MAGFNVISLRLISLTDYIFHRLHFQWLIMRNHVALLKKPIFLDVFDGSPISAVSRVYGVCEPRHIAFGTRGTILSLLKCQKPRQMTIFTFYLLLFVYFTAIVRSPKSIKTFISIRVKK